MLFNSYEFMLFFPIVVIGFFLIPNHCKHLWLLIASYVFYMGWNKFYALLILEITVVSYITAIFIDVSQNTKHKRSCYLAVGILASLLLLFVFKYYDFGLANINAILRRLGQSEIKQHLNFILPVGISFYTFQAIGYVIDVYRGTTKVERNFIRYALFVSFFPQLVAGPIERSTNLLKQINNISQIKRFDFKRIVSGLTLMLYGYFLKMVLADRLSILVDCVYSSWDSVGSSELIIAAVFFSLQIYFDFNSYSLIAIGAAKVMGFTLMWNFDTPYFATSIKDFWRRWHISLSQWLKDYVYIPLGGNKKGRIRKYINLMITFLISGLWHGAAWHYVVWGGIHGVYQIVGDCFAPLLEKFENSYKKTASISYKITRICITYFLVCIALIFFRAESISQSIGIIKRIICKINPWVLFGDALVGNLGLENHYFKIIGVALAFWFLVELLQYKKHELLPELLSKQVVWCRWAVLVFMMGFIGIYGVYGPGYDASSFIYFQF